MQLQYTCKSVIHQCWQLTTKHFRVEIAVHPIQISNEFSTHPKLPATWLVPASMTDPTFGSIWLATLSISASRFLRHRFSVHMASMSPRRRQKNISNFIVASGVCSVGQLRHLLFASLSSAQAFLASRRKNLIGAEHDDARGKFEIWNCALSSIPSVGPFSKG